MQEIHVLDHSTIDKIAAGEVVERPASVVKELTENSLDAGAHAVTVEIKGGGINLIRVTDDGCGIDRSQLENAFMRHATSKIKTAEDLSDVMTMGFRGEAIASIAAVSMMEMVSKIPEDITGTSYTVEGGVHTGTEEVGAPDGTTVIVRDLFYNTLPRRKFLKKEQTEGSYVADLMERLAISRPDVSFKFIQNNMLKFQTSGDGDLKEVIYRIFGREMSEHVLPVKEHDESTGIDITGYIGDPAFARSNRDFEFFFVNHRCIESKLLSKAVEEGYLGFLMQHKFPFCILFMTIDTHMVDVNVHPSKREIRLSRQDEIFDLMSGIVHNKLSNVEEVPDASLDNEKKSIDKPAPIPKKDMKDDIIAMAAPDLHETVNITDGDLFDDSASSQSKVSEPDVEFRNHDDQNANSIARKENLDNNCSRGNNINDSSDNNQGFNKDSSEKNQGFNKNSSDKNQGFNKAFNSNLGISNNYAVDNNNLSDINSDVKKSNDKNINAVIDKIDADIGAQLSLDIDDLANKKDAEGKIISASSRVRYNLIGQVFETYWLIEFDGKLLIMDQHAAHEKVMFEHLMKQYREGSISSQMLNPPFIMTLTPSQIDVVSSNKDSFESLGFSIEDFGGNEIAIRSVPMDLYRTSPQTMLDEILEDLRSGNVKDTPDSIRFRIASMSCKAAVKGNNRLSVQEAEALLDELMALDDPYHCPHGRPTIITISKYEMDRKFKRIAD